MGIFPRVTALPRWLNGEEVTDSGDAMQLLPVPCVEAVGEFQPTRAPGLAGGRSDDFSTIEVPVTACAALYCMYVFVHRHSTKRLFPANGQRHGISSGSAGLWGRSAVSERPGGYKIGRPRWLLMGRPTKLTCVASISARGVDGDTRVRDGAKNKR